jgi:hypothetical protein
MKALNAYLFFGLFLLLFSPISVLGQGEIEWNFEYDSKKNELVYTAQLADGWHLYSQYIDENSGPVATAFILHESKALQLAKTIEEPKGITIFDKNFNAEITYFSDEVRFTQGVKSVKKDTVLKGKVLFMVCDDHGCLPPDVVKFEIEIKK